MSTAEKITEKVVPILKQAGVTRSALFGSVARGTASAESDVDLLVKLRDEATLFDVIALKLKLEETLRRKVDVVEYSALKPRLKDRILKDQIPIL